MKNKAIFFMTGMSDYGNTNLSPIQKEFLDNLSTSDSIEKVYLNFPYMASDKAWRDTNIVEASLSNGYQFLKAKFTINENHRKSCIELINQYDEIFILSGSCGLEIFNSLKLENELCKKINIFAYGAVAGRIPQVKNIWLIKGRKDWLAVKKHDLLLNCSHMDYLEQKKLKDFVEERIK